LVQRLLNNGASVEVRDKQLGASPLAVAAFCGSIEVLILLVKAHPELLNQPTDTASCTPLWLGTRAGHTACVQALLKAGADPSLADESGLRPCDVAQKYGRKELVAILAEYA
jgi:ankyrin repeat protein